MHTSGSVSTSAVPSNVPTTATPVDVVPSHDAVSVESVGDVGGARQVAVDLDALVVGDLLDVLGQRLADVLLAEVATLLVAAAGGDGQQADGDEGQEAR